MFVIVTNHNDIDYDLIRLNEKLIIDTRNVYHDSNDYNIIRLGQGNKAQYLKMVYKSF